jgi:hypothetical protein
MLPIRNLTGKDVRCWPTLLKKDFRSQSEEESFKNGFLSRILIQTSRISDSIIAHRGGFAAH